MWGSCDSSSAHGGDAAAACRPSWGSQSRTTLLDSRRGGAAREGQTAAPAAAVVVCACLSYGVADGAVGYVSLLFASPQPGDGGACDRAPPPQPGSFERDLLGACRCAGEHLAASRAARAAAAVAAVVEDLFPPSVGERVVQRRLMSSAAGSPAGRGARFLRRSRSTGRVDGPCSESVGAGALLAPHSPPAADEPGCGGRRGAALRRAASSSVLLSEGITTRWRGAPPAEPTLKREVPPGAATAKLRRVSSPTLVTHGDAPAGPACADMGVAMTAAPPTPTHGDAERVAPPLQGWAAWVAAFAEPPGTRRATRLSCSMVATYTFSNAPAHSPPSISTAGVASRAARASRCGFTESTSASDLFVERHECVSVVFCDVVGFTSLCERIAPEDVMRTLHRLFSRLDALCERCGLYKAREHSTPHVHAAHTFGRPRAQVETIGT